MRSPTAANVLAILAVTVTPVIAETLHGLLLFTRHGDRTSKFYKGYQMTNLGADQLDASGRFYRSRYIEKGAPHQVLGIEPDKYKATQLWASAPDQLILLQTGTYFFQGLYPPLAGLDQDLSVDKLTNGTNTTAPLNGYQYVQIHDESADEPDTIWIKGDDDCPVYNAAAKTYQKSNEYLKNLEGSRDFYKQFVDVLANILPAENVSYANAYQIFDLLNVGYIHNASVKAAITPKQLDQLRYYADASEFAQNYNSTQPDRSIGGETMAGGILRQLNQTVSSQGKMKLSIFIGSYDTFLALFGLMNVTADGPDFMGLPNYASSLAFELFTEKNMTAFPTDTADLRVRFLFRNGTDTPLTAYPLFDRKEDSMPYADLTAQLATRSIRTVGKWCSECNSTASFCSEDQFKAPSQTAAAVVNSKESKPRLTNAQAGVIGAMTTLGVVAILAAAAFFAHKKRSKPAPRPTVEKRGSGSEASSA